MKPRIYLSPPHLGGSEQNYIQKTLASNWIAPVGENIDQLEKDLARYAGVSHACLLNSATSAIHLALVLQNIGPGDVVFIQSNTHIGSANPILYCGASPVFIDSEEDSWNMSPVYLEEAITVNRKKNTGKAGVILPVHLYGMPAQMDKIAAIGEKYHIPVIEDAAESLGSTFENKCTGSFGKMGIYSFNGNKIITTSGGGALVSNELSLIEKARFLATQACDPAPHYQHSEIGYNYRMSNVLAGIGRGQMEVLPERVKQRRTNFERYHTYFGKWNTRGFDIQFQPEREGSFSNRWLTCILTDPERNRGLTREEIRLALEAENIESRPLWKPMHLQPVFENYPFFGDGTSERLFHTGLCLPSGSNLTEADFERIFKVLDRVFAGKE